MTDTTNKKRNKENRGRPKTFQSGFKRISISIRADQFEKLKKLGFSKWIQEKIDQAKE